MEGAPTVRLSKLLVPVVAAVLSVTACGGDDSPSADETPANGEEGADESSADDQDNGDDSDGESADDETETEPDGEEVDAVALFGAIAEATESAGSFEFETASDGGQDFTVTGAMQVGTDVSDANTRMTTQLMGEEMTMLIVDGQFFMEIPAGTGDAFPGGGSWLTMDPGSDDPFTQEMTESLGDVSSPADLLGDLTENPDLLTVTRVGSAEVDGVAATEYHVVVNDVAAYTGDAEATVGEIAYSMWVGDDNLIRRTVTDTGGVKTETNFLNYGVDVNVEAPPADEVVDMSEMMNQ